MLSKKNGSLRRALNASETKNKLFNTASALFTKHGYDKVTVNDITSFAGVSKGTFYNYFSSKDEVLVEQFNRIDGYYEQVMRNSKDGESAPVRAFRFINAMCEYCEKFFGLNMVKIVYMNQINLGNRPDILLKKHRPFYFFLNDIVRQGREEGDFATDLPAEEQVNIFARMARSTLYEWCLHDGAYDLKESGEKNCRQALAYVGSRLYLSCRNANSPAGAKEAGKELQTEQCGL